MLHKQLNDLGLFAFQRFVQRRVPFAVVTIHAGAMFDQKATGFGRTELGRAVQSRLAMLIFSVDIDSFIN